MALDGAFLNIIKKELENEVLNSRVDRISQPSKEEIVLTLRFKGGSRKLLISANANSPRIHFTKISLENPATPPMFCMLLRKHLNAGRLVAVRQEGLDRILFLDFEAVSELGDLTTITLAVEIMGRHSNIIMINADGKVIDSIKRVNNDVSSVRMVLPGIRYELPPKQDKLNLTECDIDEGMDRLEKSKGSDLPKALMNVFEGFSPILSREIAFCALKGQDIERERLSDFYKDRIKAELVSLKDAIQAESHDFTVVVNEREKLRDFTFIEVNQYGGSAEKMKFSSPSELLDSFYAERDRVSRMKQRSHDLLKLLLNANDRITRKLARQKEELSQCRDREELMVKGNLINANLYQLKKGDKLVTLQNFYDESCPMIDISLDPRLSPAQNAQKYYQEYKKAATAEAMLVDLMKKSEEELVYIDSVFDAVSRTSGESELLEIREELQEQGYIKRSGQKQNRMVKALPPIKYRSSDGFSILCGRNNKQNDKLTLKTAKNYDMWLHTQGFAGSHVIIESEGREISDKAITEAAIIAAFNSNGRDSSQVPVDYTKVKNVKKPNGAKPGMVIFTDYSTAYVTPDGDIVESLRVK